MTFSSIPFLFYFLPLFIGFYFLVPWKNAALLAGSLLFYAWGEPVFIFLLMISLGFNHAIGTIIAKSRSKPALIVGIVLNLAALGWFKYAGFLAGALSESFSAIGVPLSLEIKNHLPLGISFYTFQAISFLIDLYRRDAERPRGLVDTALYISMFPQLIAGPIVRYKSVADQLVSRTHSVEKFSSGARQFILGLSQKVLLANTFAVAADNAFDAAALQGLTPAAAWVGLFAYTFQIFFDFAGYSNMAIGMGRMFGFELPKNFNFPYTAQSVTEFWRRWHMTLSQWFRDYLYIPLGGNRVSSLRTYFNLWVVFLLCGLWHGAAITFVLWGAYHGAFLVIERAGLKEYLDRGPRIIRHFYLIMIAALSWVPFRAENLADTLTYYAALFGIGAENGAMTANNLASDGLAFVFVIGAIVALWPLVKNIGEFTGRLISIQRTPEMLRAITPISTQIVLASLFIASAASIAGGGYNPFIYFRF